MKEFFENYLKISDIIAKNRLFSGLINPCVMDTEEGFSFMKYTVEKHPQYFTEKQKSFCHKTISFKEYIREECNEKTGKIYLSLIVKIESYESTQLPMFYDCKTTVIYEVPKRKGQTWLDTIQNNDYKYVAIFSEWLPKRINVL